MDRALLSESITHKLEFATIGQRRCARNVAKYMLLGILVRGSQYLDSGGKAVRLLSYEMAISLQITRHAE